MLVLLRCELFLEHFIFVLDLPESFLDDLDLVVTLLNQGFLAGFGVRVILKTLFHGLNVGFQFFYFLLFFPCNLHKLPALLLFFLETFAHMKEI